MKNFKEKLALVPTKPGSYQMKNKDGLIIYVGKAKNLKNRLKSYFTGTVTGKTKMLVEDIDDFEYIEKHIDKILKYNRRIKKNIIDLEKKVNITLPAFEKECSTIESKMKKLDKTIKPYKDELKKLTSRVNQARKRERIVEDYIDDNPEYEQLLLKEEKLINALADAQNRLYKRRRFSNKLNALVELIDRKTTEELK